MERQEETRQKRTILRQPAEESTDLDPGLCVHDNRVSGSITVGQTRLPLWAFVGMVVEDSWGQALEAFPQLEDYGWTRRQMSDFLYYLMEPRGEFGRLLLLLADVERLSQEEGSPRWYRDDEMRHRIQEQLQRCLDVLKD